MSKLNEIAESLGQYYNLSLVFIEKIIPLKLTVGQIKDLIEKKDHPFWLAFNEAIKLLAPQPIVATSLEVGAGDTYRQIELWVLFYKQHFNIDLLATEIKLPERRDGFNWLVIVAKGVTLNQVWAVCKKHFMCWNCKKTDDLEGLMQESERGQNQVTQAFWFRDRIGADKETKNLSANQQTEASITLIARCLLELKYFTETMGKHLDIPVDKYSNVDPIDTVDSVTLCAGSRGADGGVPGVLWAGGVSFYFDLCTLDDHDNRLRSRVAIGG